MRVAVTGSSGKIGKQAVAALRAAGHKVFGMDLRASTMGGIRTAAVDCADFGAVLGALSGIDTFGGKPDAIVHLAGIPMPGLATDSVTFQTNTISTYNVFSAAARLGIARVAWASSETILGLPFRGAPAYLPLDEDAPAIPNWSYALSKHLGEEMADQFVRWHPELTIVSLRFSNVFDDADYAQIPTVHANPANRLVNLWGYVDARDAGEACRLAIEAPLAGHERLIIAAADTLAPMPSAELVARHLPGATLKRPLEGDESLLSSARAGAKIGYAPKHSWRGR